MDRREMLTTTIGGLFASVFSGTLAEAKPDADLRIGKLQSDFVQIAREEGVHPDTFKNAYAEGFVNDLKAMVRQFDERGSEDGVVLEGQKEKTDDFLRMRFRQFLKAVKSGVWKDPSVKFIKDPFV